MSLGRRLYLGTKDHLFMSICITFVAKLGIPNPDLARVEGGVYRC